MPFAVPGALARDDEAADPHPRAVGQALEVGARDVARAGEPRAQQAERVRARADAGRPVVGEHLLPRAERPQPRRRRQPERQRELHRSPVDPPARRRDAELPQRGPAVAGQRVARPRPRQPLERRPPRPRARGEVLQRPERPRPPPRRDERRDLVRPHAEDIPQPHPDRCLRTAV
jgi:hypothetical protein